MARLNPLDEQLRALVQRRETMLDQLVNALVELDTISARLDVLLDRKMTEPGHALGPA